MGGLRPDELLELVHRLRELPLGAIDMMEVAPNWDPTGRTQALAATALIEVLSPRILKVSPAGTEGLTI
jgi:arginase family enzyme